MNNKLNILLEIESFFDDEITVSVIKEFVKLLQENDEINFEKLKAKLKHVKIKF